MKNHELWSGGPKLPTEIPMRPRVTEQSLIDCGAILTKEDSFIFQRISRTARLHYRYSDAIDFHLMKLADAKAELKREVNRIINGGNS